MPSVDSGLAAWLKERALYTAHVPAGAAAWGDRAVESEIISPLAMRVNAIAEATRQAAFLTGPNCKDRVVILGRRRDLLGKPVTLVGDRLGYEGAGAIAFVVGAQENDNGTTSITVIKRLV